MSLTGRAGSLHTFAIYYKYDAPCEDGQTEWYEEVDVTALNSEDARKQAEQIAHDDYMKGWDRIVEMEPGGSGGMVWIWQN